MVVITDGNDTASRSTEAAAIDAVREKLLFAVPVDAEATATANLASLEQITNGTRTTGTGRVISANDFAADLVRALGSASASLDGLADGVYFLFYATPKRGGSHELEVTIANNVNTAENRRITTSFNASGYSDMTPEIRIFGDEVVNANASVVWKVETLWSNDTANFSYCVEASPATNPKTCTSANGSQYENPRVGALARAFIPAKRRTARPPFIPAVSATLTRLS